MTKNNTSTFILLILTIGFLASVGTNVKMYNDLNTQVEANEVVVESLAHNKKQFDKLEKEFGELTLEHENQKVLIEEKKKELGKKESQINSLQEESKQKDSKIADLIVKKEEKKQKEVENQLAVTEAEETPEKPLTQVSHKEEVAEVSVEEPVEKPSENTGKQVITMEASGYSAFDGAQSGITAMGIDVRSTSTHNGMKIVACDPNVIPLGTIVEVSVNGEKFTAIVGDTGGMIKGNKIDILYGSADEAFNFGRQTVTVTVL